MPEQISLQSSFFTKAIIQIGLLVPSYESLLEYEGDTKVVPEKIMLADAIILGTPTFYTSMNHLPIQPDRKSVV